MIAAKRLPNACPDCGSDMVLKNSRYGLFYGCTRFPACRSTHGAHPDGSPLGVPGDAATKQARIRAHSAFDRIWENETRVSKSRARKRAYRWMMAVMGLSRDDAHIGRFSIEQCKRLVELCAGREVMPRRYDVWEYL